MKKEKCRHEWYFFEKVIQHERNYPFGSITGRYAKFICRKCGKVEWTKAKEG